MATYEPRIFDCRTAEDARAIILMPESGLSTNERWERETAYLTELIDWPEAARLVIDYGCGIGRMMRGMQPSVLGVDISASMRAQGEAYVLHDQPRQDRGFVTPAFLERLLERGLRAHGALAVWSLQHVLEPHEAIRQLFNALMPGSPLYVVNRDGRYLPCLEDNRFVWVNDGVDIGAAVESGGFVLVHEQPMPETLCAAGAWFRKYERAHV